MRLCYTWYIRSVKCSKCYQNTSDKITRCILWSNRYSNDCNWLVLNYMSILFRIELFHISSVFGIFTGEITFFTVLYCVYMNSNADPTIANKHNILNHIFPWPARILLDSAKFISILFKIPSSKRCSIVVEITLWSFWTKHNASSHRIYCCYFIFWCSICS